MAIGSPQWMYKSGEAYTVDQSLKLNNDDDAKLSWTPSSAGNRKTWTLSVWIKRGNLGSEQGILTGKIANDDTHTFKIASNDVVSIFSRISGANTKEYYGVSKLRDMGAWYHIVFAFDTTQSTEADRVKVWINGVAESFTGVTAFPEDYEPYINSTVEHNIGNFQDSSTSLDYDGYLAEMHFIDGQAKTQADFGETGTYGEWKPKEYEGSYGTNGFYLPFKNDYTVEGFSTVTWKGTGARQYIGGTGFKPSLVWLKNRTTTGANHLLFDRLRAPAMDMNSMRSDSTSAEAASFDELSGVSTDGFTVAHGGDANGDGKQIVAWNWDMGADTPTGFGCITYKGSNAADQIVTGYGFSPDLLWIKDRDAANSHHIFDKVRGVNQRLRSDSDAAQDSGNDAQRAFLPDGFRLGATGLGITVNGNDYVAWGWDMGGTSVSNTDGTLTSTVMANPTYGQSIVKYTGASGVSDATKVGHGLDSAPEMIIIRDYNNAQYWPVWHKDMHSDGGFDRKMYLNDNGGVSGTDQRRVTSVSSTTFGLPEGAASGGYSESNHIGEEHIAYCFHSVTNYSKISSYTGNGSTTGPSVTLGFRPAFVMIKVADRTDGGNGAWWMFDSTRSFGTAIGDVSMANSNAADLVNNSNLAIDFNSNGFQIKSSYDEINVNNGKYIYMAFAGGVDSMSAFNTDGTSESRVKANTTYGQSIVTYKGKSGAQTIGHGLDAAPEFIIVKNRDVTNEWRVYHGSTPGGGNYNAEQYSLRLDSTAAEVDSTYWNDTPPTSSVFTVGDNQVVNSGHGNNYFAYCWHNVTGYSKFNRYSGDGTTDGSNAVNCGFEPAFVMIKCTNDTEAWWIFDNVRNPLNGGEDPKRIAANEQDAEVTGGSTGSDWVEFTSTGFKMTGSGGGVNGNGNTYVYAAFADKREYAYWLDQSGNNNDWTTNNLTESDISVDSPTNNFATWNPLQAGDAGSVVGTISEGNLKHYLSGSGQALTMGTIAPTTGKWYCEFTMGDPSGAGSDRSAVGIGDVDDVDIQGAGNADKTVMVSTSTSNRVWLTDNVESDDNFPARTKGSIIQFAWDMDNSKVWIGIDNQWCNSSGASIPKSDVEAGNNATVTDTGLTSVSPLNRWSAGASITQTHWLNCGQDSSFSGYKTAQGNQDSNGIGDFYYEPPSGFLALCTDNLSTPAVKPSENFDVVTYTGTGSGQSVAVNFQPDLTWIKLRSDTDGSVLSDAVRGATKFLSSTYTQAENDNSAFVSAFTSTGLTLGGNRGTSESGKTYVAWNWKAGTSVSGNSSGSGTTTSYTGSVNTDAGFSIIKYTGNATAGLQIPHHLGVVPDAIFIKSLTVQSWNCFFPNTSLGATKGLQLDNDGAEGTVSHLNNTMPTTSVVTLGTGAGTNTSADGVGQEYIMYCWANKDGYSKVGSYTGTGNSDGTFVYTGHRPSLVLVKSNSRAESWGIYDSERLGYNPNNRSLYPNLANAEHSSTDHIDILSNGFKLYSTNHNGTGESYIFLSIAETPFKYSNGR